MLEERTERTAVKPKKHCISIENRTKGVFTGVQDIDSFNSELIIAKTEMGEMHISGRGLHVIKLDMVSNELHITGTVDGLHYKGGFGNSPGKKESFLSKVFNTN